MVTDYRFDSLVALQQPQLQRDLEKLFPESEGYFVTGPLDPLANLAEHELKVFSAVRVVCPSYDTYRAAPDVLARTQNLSAVQIVWPGDDPAGMPGWPGLFVQIKFEDRVRTFQVITVQGLRFLVWAHQVRQEGWHDLDATRRRHYAEQVSAYLHAVDTGDVDAQPPQAVDYGLLEEFDLYAPDPDYVITGYQDYKDFLYSYRELETAFAHGIIAFIPTAETLAKLKRMAPLEAHRNKEAPRLQEEYREFFARGGDVRIIQTLTKEGFDTLTTGEYIFAVGLSGKIRIAHELPREDMERIEKETGTKVPRANHAFLFPGEAILTAGAFFVDEHAPNRLVKVNAQSGHYFYSNSVETVREDIAEWSDHYLLTLGHFFYALDALGIPYEGVLISKL